MPPRRSSRAGATPHPRGQHRRGSREGREPPVSHSMRVPVGVKVGAFALVVMGTYTHYANIMPAVDKPPIALNRSEVWALTAFLESLGGTVDVTLDDIPKTVGAAAAGGAPAELKIPGDPKAGEVVFTGKAGCIACHKAGKIGASPVGPDLSQIARIQPPDYIMKKILDPAGAGTVAGYPKGVMPPMFGQSLTAKEYVDLVAFLMTLK